MTANKRGSHSGFWVHIQNFISDNWHHALGSVLWVVGFVVIAFVYRKAIHKYGDEKANFWGWTVFNAGLIFVGAYAAHGQQIKIDSITIPHILTTPVFIIIAIALAKVMVGIFSLPLNRGILPNTFNALAGEKSQKTYVDALDYNDALAYVMQRMMEEEFRDDLAVLRFKCQTDDEFINEVTTLMTKIYDIQLTSFDLHTILLLEPPARLQDRSLMPDEIDFATFTQIATAAKNNTPKYWETGVAEPFIFWGRDFLFVLCTTSSPTIPSRVLENYLSAWNVLCESPYIKDRQQAIQRANGIGVMTQQDAEQYLATTS